MKDPLEYTEEELNNMSTSELKELYHESEQKESLYNTSQLVQKVLINSLYGAMSNRYFPLFNQDMARAITGNGRYYIKKMSKYINEDLQKLKPIDTSYMLYNDTDSGYFTIEPILEDYFKDKPEATLEDKVNWADEFYKTYVNNSVQRSIDDLCTEFNAYNKDVIGAEREVISEAGVFNAKKKYFMRVNDSEGVRYEKPKIKIMGLEIIKSSTPPFSRKFLKESVPIILDSTPDEMINWINDVAREEFIKAELTDISGVGGVSNINYDLVKDKGVPIGSRAAIVHNDYITKNNMLGSFNKIESGDKTKRLYLLEPNPLNSNIVAYTDPRFIEMFRDYIDYDTNFQKLFLKPLEIMTNALKWDLEKTTASLDDW